MMKITVMLGGPSAEREISLLSGTAVVKALRCLGHDVTELDPQEPGWRLPEGTEVVFLALHGTYGEDGAVQQELESLGVAYTGCGPEASRIAFDKVLTKQKLVAAGIPTPRFTIVNSASEGWPKGWIPPIVVKPSRQGSSVGVSFVENVADWSTALSQAFQYDTQVLIEEKISGRETTVGILDNQALPIIEVRPHKGFYDYKNKYTAGRTEYLCPASFDLAMGLRIQ